MNNFMFLEAYLLNLRTGALMLWSLFISSNLHSYLFIVDFISRLIYFLTKMQRSNESSKKPAQR